jgi:hypothetical protein
MVLLLALGILPYLPAGFYLDYRELLTFALISMALVVLVSVYHLSTMIDRKKRKTDMSAAN